jgi:phenylpropionate dioxygenase-like ring-hydroxylating dioxygenase large terminal subunit
MNIQFAKRGLQPISSIVDMAAQPDAAAVGVAPDIYLSSALLDLEYERIFKHTWACVGRVDELANPGDFLTTDIGIVPVIVNRRDSGEIGAMVNVCSHRLATVAKGTGNAKRFACPYHGWVYDADGTLKNAPWMPDDFDKSNCSLAPVQVECWNGFIYVNVDPDAPSLTESLKPLETLFYNYHMENMRTLVKGREVWDTNWKIATENFLESYHLEMTHANSLGPFFPQDTLRMVSEGADHAFHAFTVADQNIHPIDPSIALANPDLTEADKRIVYVGGVFPNHLFTVAYDQFTWMRAQPIAVDKTLIEWGIAGAFNIPRGTKPDPDHPNLYYLKEIPHLNIEDRGVTEAVYRGARSGMVSPSRLHPNEHGLLTFARFLARHLGDEAL